MTTEADPNAELPINKPMLDAETFIAALEVGTDIVANLPSMIQQYGGGDKYIALTIYNGMPGHISVAMDIEQGGSKNATDSLADISPGQWNAIIVDKPGLSKAIEACFLIWVNQPIECAVNPGPPPSPAAFFAIRVPNDRGFNQFFPNSSSSPYAILLVDTTAPPSISWSNHASQLEKVTDQSSTFTITSDSQSPSCPWGVTINGNDYNGSPASINLSIDWEVTYVVTSNESCNVSMTVQPTSNTLPLFFSSLENPTTPILNTSQSNPYALPNAEVGDDYSTQTLNVIVSPSDWVCSYPDIQQPQAVGNYTFAVNDLPAWLTITSPSAAQQPTLVLTPNGEPKTAGTNIITVVASDNAPVPRTGTIYLSITVTS